MLKKKEVFKLLDKALYKKTLKGRKRYWTFRVRAWLHNVEVKDLLSFFSNTPERKQVILNTPSFLEQLTRCFFYKNSTYSERSELIKNHINIIENKFTTETISNMYIKGQQITVMEKNVDIYKLQFKLFFIGGMRKEGCLGLLLYCNDIPTPMYQIIFWLGGDVNHPDIYIGALQGPTEGADLIKPLTKACFGYRTKNLIFYALRCFAQELSANAIYAVTNDGYYAMNHVRIDRKLKTDFAQFWKECEGRPADDKRFYKIPIEEHRKSMGELKPSKRAQHRRRFDFLDSLKTEFHTNMTETLKHG